MICLKNITFSYGDKIKLKDFSLTVNDGEIMTIMGASGSGKTTIFKLILGLVKPQKGTVENTFQKTSVSFQEPRLFPTLTVYENLALIESDTNKIDKILADFSLADCKDQKPSELSGGQKQRVNLARAILFDGDLFLFDEPFTGLDEELKTNLLQYLKEFILSNKKSAIFILHNKEEAEFLSPNIVTS